MVGPWWAADVLRRGGRVGGGKRSGEGCGIGSESECSRGVSGRREDR